MPIPAKRISRMVRFKLDDNDEVKYSSFEMLSAINECIRYLNQNTALENSDFLEKIKTYRLLEMNKEVDEYNKNRPEGEPEKEHYNFAETGVEMPDDLLVMVDVRRAKDHYPLSPCAPGDRLHHNHYRVFGNRIFTGCDFNLYYRARINEIEDVEKDSVNLPNFFLDLIAKMTAMILEQNPGDDIMSSEISRLVSSIIPRRRYTNVKIAMPFKV